MEDLKTKIMDAIKGEYATRRYPDKNNLAFSKDDVDGLVRRLGLSMEANVEFKDCAECEYNYTIAISEAKDIPVIPDCIKGDGKRLAWIKKYGKQHYQMYVSISRLDKFAMFYWTEYNHFLFESNKRRYQSPHDSWKSVTTSVIDVLSEMNINVVPPTIFEESVDIDYEGKVEGFDNKPSILKLLFGEELH